MNVICQSSMCVRGLDNLIDNQVSNCSFGGGGGFMP